MKKLSKLLALFFVSMIAQSSCTKAKFTGSNSSAPAPAVASTPSPSPLPVEPKPTPELNVPIECENTVGTTGVHDASSNLTFRLMDKELSYKDGVDNCASLNKTGKLIYQGQDLPDEVLKCQKALGILWLRASSTSLWQPEVQGTEDPNAKHWVICYY